MKQHKKVLLADDDRDLVDLLRYFFQRDGYQVAMAFDGEMALRVFEIESPDLVILDLAMPKRNGMEVLGEIRRKTNVPVIVLTASANEEHLVDALEVGAEDYLVKPFRPRELRARARAVLRRTRERGESYVKPSKPLSVGGLTLDPIKREVALEGKVLALTAKQFGLLHYLMLNRDIVLRVADIMMNVWGYDSPENEEVVKVTIHRLRQKVEPDPGHPHYIVTVPGYGYKFQSRED
jgi:DNA-binding response OmpR family regulator